jgi:hypothetical protein
MAYFTLSGYLLINERGYSFYAKHSLSVYGAKQPLVAAGKKGPAFAEPFRDLVDSDRLSLFTP